MGAQEGWHSHTAAPRHGVEAQGKAEQKAGQTSLLLTQGGRISSNTTAKWIDTNNEWTPGGVRAERCLLHCIPALGWGQEGKHPPKEGFWLQETNPSPRQSALRPSCSLPTPVCVGMEEMKGLQGAPSCHGSQGSTACKMTPPLARAALAQL